MDRNQVAKAIVDEATRRSVVIYTPRVVRATVRDGDDAWHVECRFSDGQKFAAIHVDREHEGLAHVIAEALNALSGLGIEK
jgi:hypothetical protein